MISTRHKYEFFFTVVEYAVLCFSEYFNDIWKCQMDPSLWSKEILIYNTDSQQSSLLGKIMQNDTEIKFCLQWKHQSKQVKVPCLRACSWLFFFKKKSISVDGNFAAHFHPLPFERFYDMKKCKCKKVNNRFRGGMRIRCQEGADGYFLFRTTHICKL